MPTYWLDSSVLIRPHREGFYSLTLAPTFWSMLEQKSSTGELAIPRAVSNELVYRGDDLANWTEERQQTGLFVDPDQSVQDEMTNISDYVISNYPNFKAQEFLGGADPWVIAHASADEGIIVTSETRVNISSQYPKIPNVAQAFRVQTIDLFRMLRLLNVTIEFK